MNKAPTRVVLHLPMEDCVIFNRLDDHLLLQHKTLPYSGLPPFVRLSRTVTH